MSFYTSNPKGICESIKSDYQSAFFITDVGKKKRPYETSRRPRNAALPTVPLIAASTAGRRQDLCPDQLPGRGQD
jgi:hypothetical protein